MIDLGIPLALVALLDVVAWGVFHTVTGLAAHHLADHRLTHDGPLLRQRPFEDGGRWYRRRVRINRWKDRLPEAGDLFRGGVSKRRLPAHDLDGLALFARETRRAELTHWWAMACGPLFVLWNPPLAAALLVTYGVLVNLPFIMIQRYNRFRIDALTSRLVR